MAQKSILETVSKAIPAWLQHIQGKIQTDYASATGTQLEEITIVGGSGSINLSFSTPDRKKMTGIETQEEDVWVPATTFATKDKDGRPTMRKRKAHKRKKKTEVKTEESSSPRADSKPSQTGSDQWVVEKIIDYHFKKDFGDFLIKHLASAGFEELKRVK